MVETGPETAHTRLCESKKRWGAYDATLSPRSQAVAVCLDPLRGYQMLIEALWEDGESFSGDEFWS